MPREKYIAEKYSNDIDKRRLENFFEIPNAIVGYQNFFLPYFIIRAKYNLFRNLSFHWYLKPTWPGVLYLV